MEYDPYEAQLAREMIHAVLNRCPMEGSDENCQLCAIREKPLAERHRWLLELEDTRCLELARDHRECIGSQMHAGAFTAAS